MKLGYTDHYTKMVYQFPTLTSHCITRSIESTCIMWNVELVTPRTTCQEHIVPHDELLVVQRS